jgi:O-antigen/teichoic acid export membrane protein
VSQESVSSVSEDAPRLLRALETKALRAALWSVLEYGSNTGLRMVSSLVLTRLLLPQYFGEITLVTTLIFGINLLSDIGLTPSVIQSPRGDEPDFLNTVFTLQAIRGVGLWVIALLITWPMAIFYHDPRLEVLLPVLSFNTLLSGFYSTNLLTLSRHMGVRRLFAIDSSTAVVSLIVTIVWAYFRPSVWSIVGGQFAGTVYRLALSHTLSIAPGIRNRFGWDKGAINSIVHFGKWILLSTVFFFFATQADRLVLGRLISLSLLGIYGIAYQLSDIPRQIILALSSRVAYPFISKIIDSPLEEFRAKFLRYRFYVLLIASVVLSIMVVWGRLLIIYLYKAPYHAGQWMIPILAAGLWHTLLYQTTSPVLLSLGKPKYNAVGNVVYAISIVIGINIAFHYWGLFGAVIAIAAGDFPFYLVILYGATRERIRPFKQDLQLTAIFLSVLAICFSLRFGFHHLIHH